MSATGRRPGVDADPTRDVPAEVPAHHALAAGLTAARVAMAAVVLWVVGPDLASAWLSTDLPLAHRSHVTWAAIVAALTATTALVTIRTVRGALHRGALPTPNLLTVGALLDGAWLTLGYVSTGYTPVPALPLLVLAIGVYGVLLAPGRMIAVTGATTLTLVTATLVDSRPPSAALSADIQMALLLGTGLLSALVGVRLRAAGRAASLATARFQQQADRERELVASLPVGVLSLDAAGTPLDATARSLQLLGLPDTATAAEALQALEGTPDIAAAIAAWRAAPPVAADPAPLDRLSAGELMIGARTVAWRIVPLQAAGTDGGGSSARQSPDGRAALEAWPLLGGRVAALAHAWDRWAEPPVLAPAGPVARCVILLEDVTAARLAEAAGRRAERSEAVAELAAGLVHEVRNPLAAMRSAAEQLAEAPAVAADPSDAALAGIILREADRLVRLIAQVHAYGHLGRSPVLQTVALTRVLDDAVLVALRSAEPPGAPAIGSERERAGETVAGSTAGRQVRRSGPALTVRLDPDALHRVLSNLVLNALQHAPPGTDVAVTTALDPATGEVVLRVRDAGPGVPESQRARIFTPFVTGRPGGSGLGLAVAGRAAQALGGTVQLVAVDGPGACFECRLPASVRVPDGGDPAPSAGAPESSDTPNLTAGRPAVRLPPVSP